MNWLRSRLRAWLGIEKAVGYDASIGLLETRIAALECALADFKSALKAKASESRPNRPVYTDYESSQVAVLEQFREPAKEN